MEASLDYRKDGYRSGEHCVPTRARLEANKGVPGSQETTPLQEACAQGLVRAYTAVEGYRSGESLTTGVLNWWWYAWRRVPGFGFRVQNLRSGF